MANVMRTLVDTNMPSIFDNTQDLARYCWTSHSGDSFFYCNNPETIDYSDLADSGKFLTRNGVLGEGSLYTWHCNNTQRTIHSVILIYNPDTVPIHVTLTNIGLTNQASGSDRTAWENYYTGGSSETVTVAPGGYASVLSQVIPNGNVFGKIAKYNIKFEGEPGPGFAYFYDLVYYQDSSSAVDFAIGDNPGNGLINSRRRGVGEWYQNDLSVTRIDLTEDLPARAVTIGGINAQKDNFMDSFLGDDMVEIVGGSGRPNEHDNGFLYGAYGLPIKMTFNINNETDQDREVRIFMGCENTSVPVMAFYNGEFFHADNGSYVAAGNVRDVITLGVIPAYRSREITFETANLAQSASPFFIGTRLV